jgi:hypothetical protein
MKQVSVGGRYAVLEIEINGINDLFLFRRKCMAHQIQGSS